MSQWMSPWVGDPEIAKDDKNRETSKSLEALVRYLECRNDTGQRADRAPVFQEEHWAMLLRHMLMHKVISIGAPLHDGGFRKITGVEFTCNTCSYRGEVKLVKIIAEDCIKPDRFEIVKHCNCGLTQAREQDILEYTGHIINRWNFKDSK